MTAPQHPRWDLLTNDELFALGSAYRRGEHSFAPGWMARLAAIEEEIERRPDLADGGAS